MNKHQMVLLLFKVLAYGLYLLASWLCYWVALNDWHWPFWLSVATAVMVFFGLVFFEPAGEWHQKAIKKPFSDYSSGDSTQHQLKKKEPH